jgi:predicted DsbA family dithiol-disulfide isomerase
VKVTYYLEVISSWCHWAEPAWAELRARYAGRVEFDWRIALMESSGLPISEAQCEWFYRRSGTIVRSPYRLNPGWFDPALREYLAPNLVAEAARDFGCQDDRVRLAIANAALRDGKRVGDWSVSVAAAVNAAPELDAVVLLERAQSPEIEARARESTRAFYATSASMRPAFLLENAIGDRALFSGVASTAPLVAATEALLADEVAQISYAAHHGNPPTA